MVLARSRLLDYLESGMQLFTPLPPSLAQTRLKTNLFGLLLAALGRSIFTPYLTVRRIFVWAVDEHIQHRRGSSASWAGQAFRVAGEQVRRVTSPHISC